MRKKYFGLILVLYLLLLTVLIIFGKIIIMEKEIFFNRLEEALKTENIDVSETVKFTEYYIKQIEEEFPIVKTIGFSEEEAGESISTIVNYLKKSL